MRKKLLDKIITKCESCPMHSCVSCECRYTGKEVFSDCISSSCPLPDAPTTKVLKITKCGECCHCIKNNTWCEVVTTYPPIQVDSYTCLLTKRNFKGNSVNRIQDDCPLEDDE